MKSKEKRLQLLLLGVFVLQVSCEPKPLVSMSPSFSPIFSGDSVNLICNPRADSPVTWLFNNVAVPALMDPTLSIAVAAPKNSGSYVCECGGQRSDAFIVEVLDYLPPAQLSIKSGQPVMRKGEGFSLELHSDDGVHGWRCRVQKDGTVRNISFKGEAGPHSVTIHPHSLTGPRAMYWCHDKSMQLRSSQVTITTSEKPVCMEMLARPAVLGENLSLRCLVWGTDHISNTVFYKDEAVVQDGRSSTYQINNVTERAKGRYKCAATFTYPGHTGGPPYNRTSDAQELFVQAPPLRAVLSAGNSLVCSCPDCPQGASYRWYRRERSESFARLLSSHESYLGPTEDGIYACRAVWTDRRTSLSNIFSYAVPGSIPSGVIPAVAFTFFILLCVALVLVIYKYAQKRDSTGPVYEVVALKQASPGENEYGQLQQQHGDQGEYHTLKAAGGERREGEYEGLKKEERKGGEYDTLNTEGGTSQERRGGEYEGLKKGEMKEGEYHTLKPAGGERGEGEYEGLKREQMKGGEYDTLGVGEGAAGGGGGGAGGGDGGYQALETKDRDKEYERLQGAE
ncbi:uncharacterized protein LOC143002303 [Genypterus blacodes]|uniref:uncharacterized protein LOC143002303 n=1 Tax=Genypterus blacodes TaxID=154954 RepID=UPI003F75C7F6